MSTEVGTELGGRYVLARRIGTGGAGEVWRAHDRVLGRDVAIKLLHPELARDEEAVARFRAEAIAAARLNHPNAVMVYDVGHENERDFLVMELVEGPTFADLLTGPRLPPAAAAHLGAQVGRALGAAHARGLVHRDIKPANVLLTADGNAKVADFGIARALGEATARLTTPGTIVGTARYLAPEQLRDDPVDARSDVYAVGLLLHHALTGLPPFGDGTATEIAARRLTTDLPAIRELRPDVPAALDAAVARATHRAPDERQADGTELAADLAPLTTAAATHDVAMILASLRRSARPPRSSAPPPESRTAATPPAQAPEATSALPSTGDHESGPAAGPRDVDSEGDQRPRRARLVIAALVFAVAATAVFVLDRDIVPRGPTEPLSVAEAADHDPLGDQREHPGRIPGAFDGDPATAWTTETYFAPLGDIKDGVGLWADLGEVRDVHRIEVEQVTAGGSVEVWVGDEPPDPTVAPADWGQLAGESAELPATATIDLASRSRGRIVLLWFTDLPEVSGGWRAEISSIGIAGR